ncbi:MAG: hypothetical protein HY367_00655 [Candidatus Aenigmarchaeota archaeon]|nr:hypothetical protein [Candidatus Aenigmarchaeota archaeon]
MGMNYRSFYPGDDRTVLIGNYVYFPEEFEEGTGYNICGTVFYPVTDEGDKKPSIRIPNSFLEEVMKTNELIASLNWKA